MPSQAINYSPNIEEQYKNSYNLRNVRRQKQSNFEYDKKIAKDLSESRKNIYKKYNEKQTEKQKNLILKQLQQYNEKYTKDKELKEMTKGMSDILRSSKTTMPIKVAKLALNSREAINDYKSKFWILAFIVAYMKDTVGDFTVFYGYILDGYLFIFLFGGGFVKKHLRKKIWTMAIIFIIGLIPGLNIFIPDAILNVYLRWRYSKKLANKGEEDLKNIQKNYSDN